VKSRSLTAATTAAVLALTGCALQPNDNTFPGQVATGDDGYTVTVQFDTIENLVPNSNVQQDNVIIGTVAGIAVEDWKAEVTLRLREDVPIPADSVFSIGQKTLLGAQYVEVAPATRTTGDVPLLRDGAKVPTEQTGAYPATEQILGAAALLLNNGGLPQISTITGQLSTALDKRVPNTRAVIRRVNELLAVLDANKADIVRALESLESLSGHLAAERGTLARAVDRLAPGLRTLNEERARLVQAVAATGEMSVDTTRLIRTSREAILANLDSLAPTLTRLGEASRSLPDALKIGITIPFPAMTSTDAVKGDYANLFATLDLSLPSLAEAFLGLSSPTALDASNPVTGPLGAAPRTTAPAPTGTPAPAPSSGSAPMAPSSPASPSPSPSRSSGGTCLLGLIGDCR
jgi:phospholipid/cholesterol/gamma-HCH transport system substrate-binding protein